MVAPTLNRLPGVLLGTATIRLLTPQHDGTRPIETIDTFDDRLITELLRLDGVAQPGVHDERGPLQAPRSLTSGNRTIHPPTEIEPAPLQFANGGSGDTVVSQ